MYIFKIIKNTIYKVIYKKYIYKSYIMKYWVLKKSCIHICSKIIYKKSDSKWLITKTLQAHVLFRFSIQRSITVSQAILFLKEHQWMVAISTLLKKNEGLALVKKWRFSLGMLKSFKWVHSHMHTHQKNIWPSVIQLLSL